LGPIEQKYDMHYKEKLHKLFNEALRGVESRSLIKLMNSDEEELIRIPGYVSIYEDFIKTFGEIYDTGNPYSGHVYLVHGIKLEDLKRPSEAFAKQLYYDQGSDTFNIAGLGGMPGYEYSEEQIEQVLNYPGPLRFAAQKIIPDLPQDRCQRDVTVTHDIIRSIKPGVYGGRYEAIINIPCKMTRVSDDPVNPELMSRPIL
jgi:hypothetical protein